MQIKMCGMTRAQDALMAANLGAEGFKNGFIPESDLLLHHTDMIDHGEHHILTFTAPSELGSYDFLCTFPGHWMVMNGELVVE